MAFTVVIEDAGIYVSKFFFIRGGGKSVNIACVYQNAEKWNFIVYIDFLYEVKNGVILKSLFYYVDFISEISEKENFVSVP